MSKVQPKSWHVVVAELHDLLTWLGIDRTNVILGVVVVHNEEIMFQLKGASTCWHQPHKLLLDSSVQPLMLGKVTIDGLGLTDVNLDPCPYQNFDIHGWVREVMKVNQIRNYDPSQSQQANRLHCYASPSNGRACYIL